MGQFGRLFIIYKFRTMQIGTPDLPSDKVGEDDPRFTKSGKFLRRFSIDEFPQLFNIIKGEMVFIGPRPALHNQHELNTMRHMRGIDDLKPGITGWAQVNGRDSIPRETKVELDKYYLDYHDWQLDLKILWLTFFKTTRREGLYDVTKIQWTSKIPRSLTHSQLCCNYLGHWWFVIIAAVRSSSVIKQLEFTSTENLEELLDCTLAKDIEIVAPSSGII